ncbi:MAG: RagB/SusD family nutrient uptake outer membrane protein [Cyclobacteriaceae bacterium]
MKILARILIFAALVGSGWSCSDEDLGLNQSNPNGPSTDNYWVDLDRIENTLTSAYSGMLNHWLMAIQSETLRSDMGYSVTRTTTSGRYFHWYNQTFNNGSEDLREKWEAYYLVIFRANQVIEALEAIEQTGLDMERWTKQMAEARFLRGLMHFYAHSNFNNGNVIIRDFVPKSLSDFHKNVSPSAEVIEFFRADLEYAYENLPASNPEAVGAYRASAGAAATALGTSYLYEGEYNLAIQMFDDVINNADYGYELIDPFVLFTEEGENSKESILEINYTTEIQPEDSQWDETSFNNRLGRFTSPTGGGIQRFNCASWLVDAYVNEPMNMQDSRNMINGQPRPVSLRTSAMVAVMQDTVTTYYTKQWTADVRNAFSGNNVGYWKKYTSHDLPIETEDGTGGTSWKGSRNVIVSRLADVYLMYAEALLQGNGDVSGALSLINELRDRWALQLLGPDQGTGDDYDGVTYSVASLMDHLMFIERPLELSAEGHSIRNIDMRRWGIAEQRFTDLAAEEYYVGSFSYNGTSKKGLLVKGTAPSNEFVIDFEYDQAALNYDENLHSYLPIPLEEERNNTALD